MTTRRHVLTLPASLSLALSASAAATGTTPVPEKAPYFWELMAILLPLAFIIVCLLVLLRFLRRRFGLSGPDAPLSVVQVLPVGPRERIVVLRSRAGRAFAVGVAAGSVRLLSDLDSEDLGPVDGTKPQQADTLPLLQRFMVKRS